MSQKDEARWNEKWSTAGGSFEPHRLLVENPTHLTGGYALDLACGRGQNAIRLASQGYRVLAVDISSVALETARREADARGLADDIRFQAADLDHWSLPLTPFDLIVVFRFLDRRLFGAIREGVRPGGLVYYSTRHVGVLARNPAANKAFLLQPGELVGAFSGWQILYNEEDEEDALLIARKPLEGQ